VIVAALASPAAADPLDELGFGAAATGMANARTAVATGAEAIHLDPAGVALATRPELLIGWQYAHDRLAIDGTDAGLLDAHGTTFGLAIPAQVGNVRLGVGVGLYLPDQFLARIQLTPINEPHYLRFESATHRVVVEPVVAVAFGAWAFGFGASVLADARSRELRFDVGVVGGDKQGDARLDIALPIRTAPLASVRWAPSRKLELAAAFRGELSLDLDLDIVANIDVPNVVTGTATVALRSVSYFTPMRATVGAALHPRDDLTLTGDLTWEHWSALGSGVPDLRVLLALDIQPPLVSSIQPPANFHDIVTPRAGAEWQTGTLRLRAGAAYLPTPVPPQTGLTSFADGARVLATAGAGLRVEPGEVLTQPIELDVAVAWQHVLHELVRKDEALQPGGAFSSGGDIVQASASATVRF
jgi:hypothetical protein